MQENKTLSRAERLDKIFGTPVFAVLLAIFCNVLWGSAFPFIKLGYRLFSIETSSTASIFCFAGVRFMLGSFLVLLGSVLLQSRLPKFPRGKVAAECCRNRCRSRSMQQAVEEPCCVQGGIPWQLTGMGRKKAGRTRVC